MLQKIEKHLHHCTKRDLFVKRWGEPFLSQTTKNLSWRYMPSFERYYFELNPSFIIDYSNLVHMSTYPFVMLRDGYLGLYFFFLRNPKPLEKMETFFLIPKKFENLIPKQWKDNILTYDFSYNTNDSKSKKSLIYGSMSSENFISETAADKINRLVPKGNSLSLISLIKERYFFENKNEIEFTVDALKALFKLDEDIKIAKEFNFLDWNHIDSNTNLINIDTDNFLVYSDYTTHFLVSKGAHLLYQEDSSKDKAIKRINMSPYHLINIYEPKNLTNKILKDIFELREHNVALNYSSPNFFAMALNSFRREYKTTS